MRIHVINLDRSADRLAAFLAANRHLTEIRRVAAADGAQIVNEQFVRAGLITPAALPFYTRGALGCALSHVTLWQEAIAGRSAATIAEDDAILRRDFEGKAAAGIERLPEDWDIAFWGCNVGAHIAHGPIGGSIGFDVVRLETAFTDFQSARARVRLDRLEQMLGLVCYSISPKGAAALMALCLPLRPVRVHFQMLEKELDNYGLDVAMNAHYPKLKAFVAIPPLALSPNDAAGSTVQRRR